MSLARSRSLALVLDRVISLDIALSRSRVLVRSLAICIPRCRDALSRVMYRVRSLMPLYRVTYRVRSLGVSLERYLDRSLAVSRSQPLQCPPTVAVLQATAGPASSPGLGWRLGQGWSLRYIIAVHARSGSLLRQTASYLARIAGSSQPVLQSQHPRFCEDGRVVLKIEGDLGLSRRKQSSLSPWLLPESARPGFPSKARVAVRPGYARLADTAGA